MVDRIVGRALSAEELAALESAALAAVDKSAQLTAAPTVEILHGVYARLREAHAAIGAPALDIAWPAGVPADARATLRAQIEEALTAFARRYEVELQKGMVESAMLAQRTTLSAAAAAVNRMAAGKPPKGKPKRWGR